MSECHIKQPSANNCFVCGRHNDAGLHMHFYDNDRDTVCSTHSIDRRYEGYPGIVHGGILASILDEAVGRVAMVGDHHHFMMTGNRKVQYRLPIPSDTEIKVIAKAIRMKGRIGKAHGQIFLPDGSVACEAELTLADMPVEIASDSRIEELGWQVDPN